LWRDNLTLEDSFLLKIGRTPKESILGYYSGITENIQIEGKICSIQWYYIIYTFNLAGYEIHN